MSNSVLVLDLGLHPASEGPLGAVREAFESNEMDVVKLVPENMTDDDWDQVVHQMERCTRCLTI